MKNDDKYEISLVLDENNYDKNALEEVKKTLSHNNIKVLSQEIASIEEVIFDVITLFFKFSSYHLAKSFFENLGKRLSDDFYEVIINTTKKLFAHRNRNKSIRLVVRVKSGITTVLYGKQIENIKPDLFFERSFKIFADLFILVNEKIKDNIVVVEIKSDNRLDKHAAILYSLDEGPKYIYDFLEKRLTIIDSEDEIKLSLKNILNI